MSDTDFSSLTKAELQKRVTLLEARLREQEQIRETLEKRISTLTQPLKDAENIHFEDIFNLDDIQQLQNEFSDATGVASIITYPDGTPITLPSNFCRLCNDVIRKTEKGQANSFKSDAVLGQVHPNGSIVHPCLSSGLWDAGASIMVGETHIANWLIGQVRDETQTEEKMRAYAREIGEDEQVFMEAFHEVPVMSSKKFEQIAKVLFTLASQLSATAYQNMQQAHFITERKLAEEKLQESEALYRSILKASPDIIAITDLDGRIHTVSHAALSMFGYTHEREILGRLTVDFLIPKDQERAQSDIGLMLQGIFAGQSEYRGVRADGSVFDIETNAKFIRNMTGQRVGIVFIIRDITERKRAMDALKESEERFRITFYTSPDSININRLDNAVCVDINDGFTRMSGYSREEVIGKTSLDLNIWYDVKDRDEMIRRVQESGYCENFEAVFLKKDGSTLIGSLSCRVISLNGGPHLISITRDITARKKAEEKLQENEALYRSTLNASPENISITDLEGRIRMTSPAGVAMFGFSREEEVLDRLITDFVVPEDLERIQSNIVRLHQGTYMGPEEYRGVRADGTVFDIESSADFIRDNTGKPIGMVVISREITEHKRAKEALQLSERNYREIFNATSEAIFLGDVANFRLLDVNDAALSMFGYETKAEIMTCRISDFMVTDAPYTREAAFHRIRLTIEQGPQIFIWLGRKKNDGLRWLEVSLSSTKIGGEGRILAVIRDITERKQAEAERELLMAAIEQAGEIVLITNPTGLIQYINPAFEHVTGYRRDEALGQNPRILKSGEHDAAFYAALWQTLTEGRTWEGRLINKRKDGTRFIEEAMISPMRDALGAIVNYVAVKRDITRELETEHKLLQAQKMESVGRLAGGVAHDFNNMLMAIMGYTEMCRENLPPDHRIRKWLDEISNAGQRSVEITRQLLAFARKQTIAPKVLDLNETVTGMIKLLHRLIGEEIRLTWLPGTALWLVKLDPSQIDQILVNLSVNARDAISGMGIVTIETENVTVDDTYCIRHPGRVVPGDYVLLVVSDNGCGMEKDVLDHIFDPFFTTKEVGKGTGMGLATVYGIIEQNHGFVTVYSEPGKGTTFRVYLPRFEGDIEKTVTATVMTPPKGQGETVLVVEDEPSLRNTCRLLLESIGYKVQEAETPEAALDMVTQHPQDIHLLLTDVIMPGMNGRQLAELLCAIKPDLKVLYMSGYTANAISQHGILEQGIHFIAKPFSRDDLARKLQEVLQTE
ncbi:MAG: PAS domain S-box protein [Chlorobiales bacterium]|nr:PAS domain S-box protein [Chlorobiales bacterium]